MGMPIQMLNGFGCPDCGGTCKGSGLGAYGKAIQYNTEPVINNFPGIDRDGFFNCADWMTWHMRLVDAFKGGKFASGIKYSDAEALKKANEVFMIWWNKQNLVSYTSICYTGNVDFRNYWKKVGLPTNSISELITKPYDFVASTQGKVLDITGKLVDSTGKVIDRTSGAAIGLTTVLKYAVPVTVTAVLAGVGYFVYKNYLKGNKKIKIGPTELGSVPRKKKRKSKIK